MCYCENKRAKLKRFACFFEGLIITDNVIHGCIIVIIDIKAIIVMKV